MSLLLAMLLLPAHGGGWLQAHVQGAAQVAGDDDTMSGVGLRVGAAQELGPRVQAELSLEGQGQRSGVGRVGAYAGLRLMAAPADRRVINPSLFAGAGVWGPSVHPLALLQLDVDVPVSAPAHLRFGASARSDVDSRVGLGVHVGVVARVGQVKARTMAGDVEPSSVASGITSVIADTTSVDDRVADNTADDPSVDDPLSDDPSSDDPSSSEEPGPLAADGQRVWDPEQCMYTDSSGNSSAGEADPSVDGESERGPRSAQGWLMVVASPGDVVNTGAIEQVVGKDGLARLRVPEGVLDVSIVGGGREQRFQAAVADRFALWLRAEPPSPTLIRFPSGSSNLSAADQRSLNTLSQRLGRWTLQIVGSYSAEGDQAANERLAQRRANSVEQALRAAGVQNLRRLPAARPRPDLSVRDQRAVYITPIAPGESE